MIDHCPTSPQELYLDGLELVLGESGLGLTAQGPAGDRVQSGGQALNLLVEQLDKRSDPLASAGLSLMAGRGEFDVLLRVCGKETHLLDPSIRMVPLRRRAFKGIEALLEWINSQWKLDCVLEEGGEGPNVILPAAFGGESEGSAQALAAFLQGLMQGMLTWISGGRFYPAHLEETGRGWEIQISRSPID